MPEHGWILLNVAKHDWINWSEYASVLNMARYSYSNTTIIAINVILEFLSAVFVHPGTLVAFHLF